MSQKLPPALEQEIQRFDTLRREYESLQVMTQTMQSELAELRTTLEELQKQPDSTVTYKTVGQIMFRVEKAKIVEELVDRQKTLEMRIASISKRIETSAEKLKELQAKIQLELGKANLRLQ